MHSMILRIQKHNLDLPRFKVDKSQTTSDEPYCLAKFNLYRWLVRPVERCVIFRDECNFLKNIRMELIKKQ